MTRSRVVEFSSRPWSKHRTPRPFFVRPLQAIKALQLHASHFGSNWPNGKEIPLPTGYEGSAVNAAYPEPLATGGTPTSFSLAGKLEVWGWMWTYRLLYLCPPPSQHHPVVSPCCWSSMFPVQPQQRASISLLPGCSPWAVPILLQTRWYSRYLLLCLQPIVDSAVYELSVMDCNPRLTKRSPASSQISRASSSFIPRCWHKCEYASFFGKRKWLGISRPGAPRCSASTRREISAALTWSVRPRMSSRTVDTSTTSSMLISRASDKVRGVDLSHNADNAGTTQSSTEYVRASRSRSCGVGGSIEFNANLRIEVKPQRVER